MLELHQHPPRPLLAVACSSLIAAASSVFLPGEFIEARAALIAAAVGGALFVYSRMAKHLSAQARQLEASAGARRQAEDRWRLASQQLAGARELFNGARAGLLITDPNELVLLANDAAIAMLRLKDAEFPCLLEQLIERMPSKPLCRPTEEGLVWTFREGGDTKRVVQVHRRKCASTGLIAGHVLVLQEMPSHQQRERDWPELTQDVDELCQRPLRALQTLDDLLEEALTEEDSDREDYLHALQRHASRLEELGEHLRDLCRIEKDSRHAAHLSLEWHALVDEAARRCREISEGRSVQIAVRHEGPSPWVEAHREALLNALLQLMQSCQKAAPAGGALRLVSGCRGDSAVLEIRVDSPFNAPQDSGQAAVSAARLANAWLRQGTGAGLPLAKHVICELHGGSLSVDQPRKNGPRFRVTMPARG